MASKESCLSSESDPIGYKYEFIDKIPEDLLCQRCKHVAREPNFTTCCLFCKECISLYHHNNQLCPTCEETGFNVGLKKQDQKKILALKMCCPMKSRGCEWMGQLEQLENHRRVCSYLPVQCPNRCGVMYERENFEDHMKICIKEELECCFSHAGCQGRFLREDKERHMEENTKKHLSLIATAMLKISKEMEKFKEVFQNKLEQQKIKFQEDLQGKEEELQKIREELKKTERKIDEMEFQRALEEEEHGHNDATDLKDKVAELQYNTGYVPWFHVTITMPLYELMKAKNEWWYSQVLYTYIRGYSLCISKWLSW